jgi:hypothetical protein
VQKLLANIHDRLGFDEKEVDTQQTLLHRIIVVTWACRLGVESCTQKATELFTEYREKAENNPYVYHNYLIRHNLRREYTCFIQIQLDVQYSFFLESFLLYMFRMSHASIIRSKIVVYSHRLFICGRQKF